MRCSVCGENVGVVLLRSNKYYCDYCWYRSNPPIFVLTKTWHHSQLFSPRIDRYVYPEKNQLKRCGFTLFNKKIFFNKEANRNYKEVLIYRYTGNQRCQAIDEFDGWPPKMPECGIISCTLRK